MIGPDKAWDIVVERTTPLPVRRQKLAKSQRYVLAEPISADRDLPPADRAAMDGYAVRAEDLEFTPVKLPVCGEVAAGSAAAPEVSSGQCARIFTGANLPPGADTVVMVEDTAPVTADSTEQELVTFLKTIPLGKNIFRQGENARQGEILIQAGVCLNSAHIGVCAAVGYGLVKVHQRPKISILATGKELLGVNAKPQAHQIRDSNTPVLLAALESRGFEVTASASIPDKVELILKHIRRAFEVSDVVLLTGGVSVGNYDFVPEAVRQTGSTIHVHGVAMKPGKPLLFATSSEGKCIFGLPGNPLSVMTGFYEFVLPALQRLAGLAPAKCRQFLSLRLSKSIPAKGGRQRYVLGKVCWREHGPEVEPVKSQGSADLVAGGKADGAIIVPADETGLSEGSIVKFRPWRLLP